MLLALVFVAALFPSGATQPAAGATPRLLAYYPYWAKQQSPPYTAAQIPYNELTHILHAFALPDADGKLKLPKGLLEPALISDAHAAGVRVSISIGGAGGKNAKNFAKIAASASTRATFAKNVHAFLNAYGYDGVDIDWEVPSKKEMANCTALMQALRTELPAGSWLISMAIPADPRSYGAGFNVPQLNSLVDFFNVMTYDFTGPWMSYAGHNSPLYQSSQDPGQSGSLKTSMDLFTSTYGVAPAKLNIGTAFYGYQFDGVGALWQSCGGTCRSATQHNYGTYIKQLIGAQGWTSYLDTNAMVPYLLHSSPAGFITYDDADSSSNKVAYVIGSRGFGGIFMWDLSADYDGTSQDLLSAMYAELQVLEHGDRAVLGPQIRVR
jgi:chitinase